VKPERAFIAERALAQHCPELLGAGAGAAAPVELLPTLGRAGAKLARAFAAALSPLVGGQELAVQAAAPREATAAVFVQEIAPLAANSLLGFGGLQGGAALLASFDAGAVLRMIDRAFGGTGKAPAEMPAMFPASAGVVIRQLEAIVAQGFAAATGAAGFEPLRRGGNLVELEPFAEATPLAILTLTVAEAGSEPWPVHLALPFAALENLVGEGVQAPARLAAPRQPNPAEAPYADLPRTLPAVGLHKATPQGVIGSVDDRVAIQITQAF